MVKITRKFRFVYPIDVRKEKYELWDKRVIIMSGKASIDSRGQHPIYAGWYKLDIRTPIVKVDIVLTSIVDQTTEEEILPRLQEPDHAELLAALVDLCADFNRNKFLL